MNLQKPKFIDLHQNIAQIPQYHISIYLLGPYNATSQGNHVFADIMLKFDFPRILHSDCGAEFDSKLMKNLSQTLG